MLRNLNLNPLLSVIGKVSMLRKVLMEMEKVPRLRILRSLAQTLILFRTSLYLCSHFPVCWNWLLLLL